MEYDEDDLVSQALFHQGWTRGSWEILQALEVYIRRCKRAVRYCTNSGASLCDKLIGTRAKCIQMPNVEIRAVYRDRSAEKEKKQQWQEALHLPDYPEVLASIARTCAQSGLIERWATYRLSSGVALVEIASERAKWCVYQYTDVYCVCIYFKPQLCAYVWFWQPLFSQSLIVRFTYHPLEMAEWN